MRFEDVPTFTVIVANGSSVNVSKKVILPIYLEGHQTELSLFYLPSLAAPILLGLDFLRVMQLCLDCDEGKWWFKEQPHLKFSLILHDADSPVPDPPLGTLSCGVRLPSSSEKDILSKVVSEGLELLKDVPGLTTKISHKIDTGNSPPIKQRPYRYSPKVLEAMQAELDKLLADGKVEPSHSAWASPVVMVRKGDGYRMTIDYRKVNLVSKKDSYPMPNLNFLLDSLRQARYLSKLDLCQAFLQVPLEDEKSKEVTSFIVPGRGLFRYLVMPFGLTNSPATFQRLADSIFGPDLYPYVIVFLDDILICTPDLDSHLYYLKEVFSRLKDSGLKINPDKCEFGCREVRYLGYRVNEQGMCTDPEKIEPVLSFPAPANVKELRRFLGMAGWYRRFIPDFSTTVSPLTSLLKNKSTWVWGYEQNAAFDMLKQYLTTAPVLARPDFGLPFTLQTDASQTGLGAVLTQVQDGHERVIAYCSRTLSPAERNYTVTEKECLAVLFGIEKNRHYLEGYPFKVITDHASLRWLLNLKDPSGRLARWVLRLQPYNFEIEYRKGKLNTLADALSRSPVESALAIGELDVANTTQDDEWYSRKFQRVQANPDGHPDWKVEDGRLFYFRKDFLKEELHDPSDDWKLVVPWSLRRQVLQECHDRDQSGHLGIAKTHWRVARLYYWPGMYQDIVRYIHQCDVCQRVKPQNTAPKGEIFPRYLKAPWDIVSTDIMGPFPRSSKGNLYLLVFQDTFTKWVELVPIRKATSEVIVSKLRSAVLYRYGTPRLLISDNAKNFIGSPVQTLAKNFGFTLKTIPYYHSQANPVERANRNIKQLIVTYLNENHQKWDQHLEEIQFALNTAVQNSTGYSPAFLNFGREPKPPISLRHESSSNDHNEVSLNIPSSTVDEWSKRISKIKEIYHLVETNLLKSANVQCHRYNLRRNKEKFKVGDKVLRKSFRLSSAEDKVAAKLFHKFEGPFTVDHVSAGGSCRLVSLDGKPAGLWHPSKLKLYHS